MKEKALDALKLVDLLNVKDKYPAQMRWTTAASSTCTCARSVSDILLLDEPLSALDAKVREKLRREMRDLQEKIGVTTIMVTHDQEEALTMADKIVVMNHAEIMQIGTPRRFIKDQPIRLWQILLVLLISFRKITKNMQFVLNM